MKIGIIGFSTIELSPYLVKFINLLSETNVDFFFITRDLSFKAKKDVSDDKKYTIFCRKRKMLLTKFFEHLKWRKKVIRILKAENPNKIIVLTQYPAFLLKSFLFKNYRFNYYFDIRDYNPFLSSLNALKEIIDNSALTFISSNGFRKWLPKSNKIITNHNLPQEPVNQMFGSTEFNGRISIAYFGAFSYLNENKRLIKMTGNKQRFSIYYAGFGEIEKDLKEICLKHKFNNIYFLGKFKREDKPNLYKNINFINAIYGCKSLITTTALPNKFYDCLTYHIPIIASKGTYLGEIVEKEAIGFVVNKKLSDFETNLDAFIKHFNRDEFVTKCNMLLNKYKSEEDKMKQTFIQSIAK